MAATSWDSLDSWLDILTLVGMSLHVQRDAFMTGDLQLPMYRQYHNLRLVCKAFRDLFRKHPSLSDRVLVREGLPGSRLPQLLNALHRNQASTQTLISFAEAPAADAALAVLLCPTPRLQKLTLDWASETTLHLVSVFTSLTFCEILQPVKEDALDVAPLSSLANLQKLSLVYGTFTNIHPPGRLKCFRVSQATATMCQNYDRHSSLLKLRVEDCELSMSGLLGICAFTNLQVLECGDHTVVTASNAANSLSLVAPIHVPADFFSLSGLTKLTMICVSSQAVGGNIDTAWLYGLSHLQLLALNVYVDRNHVIGLCMALDDKLTRLTNLQYLMAAADADCAIHFCVPWHLMTALQGVNFYGSVGITGDMSELLQASRLETITYISGIQEGNPGNIEHAREAFVRPWKELQQYTQLHHPSVDCEFEFETTTYESDDASSGV